MQVTVKFTGHVVQCSDLERVIGNPSERTDALNALDLVLRQGALLKPEYVYLYMYMYIVQLELRSTLQRVHLQTHSSLYECVDVPMHLCSPYIHVCVGLFNTFAQYADYTHPQGVCAGGLWHFLCVCVYPVCLCVCLLPKLQLLYHSFLCSKRIIDRYFLIIFS